MAASIFTFDDFFTFVERELARISRYDVEREERFSLVFLKIPEGRHDEVTSLLETNLRHSDAMFEKDDVVLLVLPNTSRMGALHIDEILKEFFESDLACVIASFPEDGDTSQELFEMLEKILEDEYGIGMGDYFDKQRPGA